jgi:hypothetical protein
MEKGMKSFPNAHFVYDRVFSWMTIVIACIVMDNAHCTIFKQVESIMITSIKVQKLFLVIKILTHCQMRWGRRWETSFCTCVPIFKTIVVTISQRISWVEVCSFLHGHSLKQVDTQIINGMSTLTIWKMCNYRMWKPKVGTLWCKEMSWRQIKCKCGT